MLLNSCIILLLAASLDYLIGDPWGWPHPVRVMGWVISLFTNLVLFQWNSSSIRRWAGIFLSVGLIVGSGFVGWVLVLVAKGLHPLVGLTVESILL
ncbi:MAG: cobalamin biosynthesis protein, partial [Symploca sp. SIO1C4]|nr:cobalamin biosynthesis protein [Symploca sp. SIO1C4]